MNQLCYKVIGENTTVMLASENAQFELNVMEPIMVYSCFQCISLLTRGFNTLRTLCIDGIRVNESRCEKEVRSSIGVVTALNPFIGYKNSTRIAEIAMKTDKGVYDIALENGILTKKDLDTILAPKNMIQPVNLTIKPNPKTKEILEDVLSKLN
jgi:aspartate ammonia-lyase